MAGTAVTVTGEDSVSPAGELEQVRSALNLVVNDLETLRSNRDLISRNRVWSAAGVARGTTAAKAKTVNTITYAIDGKILTKAGTDDFWTLSGSVVAISSWQKYVLLIDAAGAASILAGTASAVSAAAVTLPALPASKAVVGVITVATDGVTTFTPGTTALNAAGITATFIDGLDSGFFSAGASELTANKVNLR